jgi:hypothetical protein
LKAWLEQAFGLDLRSLAVLRIGLALVLIYDLFCYLATARIFLSDQGILPRFELMLFGSHPFGFSLHLMGGWWVYQVVLILVQVALAVALLVGWRTRLVTFLSWLMLLGLHQRNPYLLFGGDVWLRANLFWAIFLPWGSRWSVDSWGRARGPERVLSLASAGLIVQACLVWGVAGFTKTDPSWTSDGTAIAYALQAKDVAGPWSEFFLYFPNLLAMLTYGVILLETVGVFLLFSPLKIGPLRTLMVVIFVAFHFGIYLGMGLHTFGFIGAFTATGLLPTWAWRRRPLRLISVRTDRWFHRYRPGRDWAPVTRPSSPWVRGALAVVLVNSLLLNVPYFVRDFRLPRASSALALALGLEQRWTLFAPAPPRQGTVLEVEGLDSQGQIVPLTDRGTRREGPFTMSAAFSIMRFRQFGLCLTTRPSNPSLARAYARYVSQQWGQERTRLKEVRIYLISQPILPRYEDSPPLRTLLYRFAF